MYVPADEELRLQRVRMVWFAVRATLVAQVALNPAEGLTADTRFTLPEKLLRLVSVTFRETPVAPELKLIAPAPMVKSVTVTPTVIATGGEGLLVPVTVTMNFPAVELAQLKVEFAEVPNVRLGGVKEQLRPAAERLTIPEKPLIEVTVMLELPEAPALKITLAGLAVILKV